MTPTTVAFYPVSDALPRWQIATWDDYERLRDNPNLGEVRLFFDRGYLFVHMGNEGINHARFSRLFAMLFAFWFVRKPEQIFDDLGGGVIEKPGLQGASSDLILYLGEGSPQWQEGEPRRINLNDWRVPN